MPETVSSVCGLADGFSKCPRVIIFTDKMTGQLVAFPYKGFQWNAAASVLTLNPAQAVATCVLTATLQLANYSTVFYSQDIPSFVQQPVPALVLAHPYPLFIAPMTLNATIN